MFRQMKNYVKKFDPEYYYSWLNFFPLLKTAKMYHIVT